MPYTNDDDVAIYYEVDGPVDGEPLILVHGLGAQMVAWHPGLIALLLAEGYRVIRFDNRDVGLSTKFDDGPAYDLGDMADDVLRVLDAVGVERAHVAGQSMGGMIVQRLAIDHPDRVASLLVIYSAPGPGYQIDDPEVRAAREQPADPELQGRIAQYIARERYSGLHAVGEDWIGQVATRVVSRDDDPDGPARQAAASLESADRTAELRTLHLPAAVIHGRNDRLLSYRGGIAIAEAIADSEFHLFTGMGHELHPAYWRDIVAIVGRNVRRSRSAEYAVASEAVG